MSYLSHVSSSRVDTMSDLARKPCRSRTLRLEFLESRELLSTIPMPVDRTAEVSPMAKRARETITGPMSGTLHFVPTSTTAGTASFRATGSLTILGQSTLTGSDNYSISRKNKVKYSNGSITLSDTSGDTITASFKGSGKATATGIDTFKVKGSVTGGTGSYTGATGKDSASGTFDDTTDAFSITVTVTLTHS
jgi:hypothetical protein